MRVRTDIQGSACTTPVSQKNFRMLELVVGSLILLISGCFAYELWLSSPEWGAVLYGILPQASLVTDKRQLLIGVGILGATVMPHNLYLHSAIVQVRALPGGQLGWGDGRGGRPKGRDEGARLARRCGSVGWAAVCVLEQLRVVGVQKAGLWGTGLPRPQLLNVPCGSDEEGVCPVPPVQDATRSHIPTVHTPPVSETGCVLCAALFIVSAHWDACGANAPVCTIASSPWGHMGGGRAAQSQQSQSTENAHKPSVLAHVYKPGPEVKWVPH